MKLEKSSSVTLYVTYILIFLFISCVSKGQVGGEVVNAEELKELIKQEVLLIDVRTPNEFQRGRIAGAKLINYRDANFTEQIMKLDKDAPVAIYCAAGGRSTGAMKILQEAGFKIVYNYTGGFSDWQRRGEAIEK